MDTVRILSIDGGGIRGIIPLKILEYIEDRTGRLIHELFDVVGGTSTGGIISLGLNSKLPGTNEFYTARDLLQIYSLDGKQLFQVENSKLEDKILNVLRGMLGVLPAEQGPGFTAPEYSGQSIEKFLQNKFGQNTKLSELPAVPDVTVFSYDIENARPYYFNTKKAREKALAGNYEHDYYVWQAARATSAAPTFFPAAEFSNSGQKRRVFIDGGVFINNPTLELLMQARDLYPQGKSFLLLSLGTGEFSKSYSELKNAGVVGWVWNQAPILNIMMSAVSAAVDKQLKIIEKEITGVKYLRCQKRFPNDIGMDNTERAIIAKLQQLGEELVEDYRLQLDELCRELTQNLPQPAISKDAWLEIKYTKDLPASTPGGWTNKVTAYQPVPQKDWFWVGQYAQNNEQQPYERMLLVKPLKAEAVKPPKDFEKVWDNNSPTSTGYASCWQPIPPDGYVALGSFIRFGVKHYEKPSAKEVEGLVCIHESLVTSGEIGKFIWNDQGSLAMGKGCSIWRIKPKDGTVDAGTFYAVNNHSQPKDKVYCLQANKVNVQWS